MGQFKSDLFPRIEDAIDRTIQMVLALPQNAAGREIGRQLIRSAGSVGANLEEAQAVTSDKDFTYKVSLSLREARETAFWIRRIERNDLLPPGRLRELTTEWYEIVAIMTATMKRLRTEH